MTEATTSSSPEIKAEIIDLNNIKEKLTPWDPKAPCQLWAIVDMGSNGIRFSITSLAAPTTRLLKPVYSDRAAISLFDRLQQVDQNRWIFPQDTIDLVATTLSHFKQIALDHGVPPEQIMVLATEAMRKASNAADMLDAIKEKASGLTVSVLHPNVETLCGAVMGSRSGVVNVHGGALFLDLGGGSVQMTWVDTTLPDYEIKAALAGKSLPYGAAKLMKILGDNSKEGQEVQKTSIDELNAQMLDIYKNLCDLFPTLGAIKTAYEGGDKKSKVNVYMCGGGFRGYGSMLMHNDDASPYPIASTNAYTAPGELFMKTDKMRKVNDEYDGRIFGMSKRRRAQFPAIATVIDAFIKAVPNIGTVTFCGGSNRQGALMMKLPYDIRESNPLDALAAPSETEKPVLDAVIQLLQQSLPQEVDFSDTPTIFTEGLAPIFVQDIWGRSGYDGDSNTAFALNNAILRDPEAPGLTHLGRSLLALTGSARWAGNLGPLDAKLFEGVTNISRNKSDNAPFWAGYIGAVANIIATILPAFPKSAQDVSKALSISSHKVADGKKDKIVLIIGISPDYGKGIELADLVDLVEGVAKKRGGKKSNFKVSAEINLLS